ncbi:MAG TPA: hypothetical protein VF897_25830 [Roseiflexaceae bacterium]
MTKIEVAEKYERSGWPALDRPDARPPAGWSLSLITAVNRVHHHELSPDGRRVAFVWEREGLSDIYVMPATRTCSARGRSASAARGSTPRCKWATPHAAARPTAPPHRSSTSRTSRGRC